VFCILQRRESRRSRSNLIYTRYTSNQHVHCNGLSVVNSTFLPLCAPSQFPLVHTQTVKIYKSEHTWRCKEGASCAVLARLVHSIYIYTYVYICIYMYMGRKWMVTRPAFSSNSASRPLDGYSEGGNGEVEEGGKGMDGHKARLLFQVSQ
jgi:hypothetical protein